MSPARLFEVLEIPLWIAILVVGLVAVLSFILGMHVAKPTLWDYFLATAWKGAGFATLVLEGPEKAAVLQQMPASTGSLMMFGTYALSSYMSARRQRAIAP